MSYGAVAVTGNLPTNPNQVSFWEKCTTYCKNDCMVGHFAPSYRVSACVNLFLLTQPLLDPHEETCSVSSKRKFGFFTPTETC